MVESKRLPRLHSMVLFYDRTDIRQHLELPNAANGGYGTSHSHSFVVAMALLRKCRAWRSICVCCRNHGWTSVR